MDEAGGVALVAGFTGGVEETKAGRARQQRRKRRARPWPRSILDQAPAGCGEDCAKEEAGMRMRLVIGSVGNGRIPRWDLSVAAAAAGTKLLEIRVWV